MNTHTIQQEILLFTNTTFSQRQWCQKDNTGKNSYFTNREQLEDACWNGLLHEMLPEIIEPGHNLFLWQIRMGSSFLELELSEYPIETDSAFSIDPYIFEKELGYN